MRVVVTGGSGLIGRYVFDDLIEHGHDALNLDLAPHPRAAGRSLRVDLLSAGDVYQALGAHRPDALIHLAAWASDGFVPPARTYHDNVGMTYNVLQACADLGVRRVILASSHHVYGTKVHPPAYLPLDEQHPLRPASAYGLSKLAAEQAGELFTTVHGLEVLAFRFAGIREPSTMDEIIEETVEHPERNLRLFWTRMDARDAAGFCRAAVEAGTVTPGPYLISSREILPDEETVTLVKTHLSDTVEIRSGLAGRASPMWSPRAHEAFGYEPRYEWSAKRRFTAVADGETAC